MSSMGKNSCRYTPNLVIHGYVNETIPAGKHFHKIAGLNYQQALAYADGDKKLIKQEADGYFKAKSHRVAYKNGAKIELAVPAPKAENFADKKQDIEGEDISAGMSRLNVNKQ
jgi:hypothetical protein